MSEHAGTGSLVAGGRTPAICHLRFGSTPWRLMREGRYPKGRQSRWSCSIRTPRQHRSLTTEYFLG